MSLGSGGLHIHPFQAYAELLDQLEIRRGFYDLFGETVHGRDQHFPPGAC